MPNAPEIKVKLTAEDTGVSAAIKELTSQLKTLKSQQDSTASSSLSLSNAFNGIASAAALIGLARIGKEAFDSAINIGKMADKTGLTTQTLSVFHHVADEVGVSTDVVDKALIRGAKSITEFQMGSAAAAKGFALLGISQKQLIGLKPDQAIALVTGALGKMAAGLQKTTAAQLIFSRSGAELIPVANAIAGEGFDKITKSVSQLGLLLDRNTTNEFQTAKASLEELRDAGKGVATQFEAGLLPAVIDVSDAILKSVDISGKSGEGFQEMGKEAGTVVRDIAAGFIWMGVTIAAEITTTELIFSEAFAEIKVRGVSVYEALAAAAKGHFAEAKQIFQEGSRAIGKDQEELAKQQKAIWDDAAVHIRLSMEDLFPSDAEERRRAKEAADRQRPADPTPEGKIKSAAAPDAGAKAKLALMQKQLQDEIELFKAYFSKRAEQDKTEYDRGGITLKQYFDRRRQDIRTESEEEITFLKSERANAQGAAAKAGAQSKGASTPQEADKFDAEKIQNLTKVEDLNTKIALAQSAASTKQGALDAEQFKATEENQQKILEFDKLTEKTQGNAIEAAKKEIAIEQQKMALAYQQAGLSQAEIDKKLASYGQLALADVTFTETSKNGAAQLKELDDQRAAIEDKVANGKLFQIQADNQIRDLELARLPTLKKIADAMLAEAQASGDEEKIAAAEDMEKRVQTIGAQTNTVGQDIKNLKENLQSSVTSGMGNLFSNLVSGTMSVGNAFKSLASSVLSSLGQMAAQMLAQIILTKLLKAAMGGMSGGGLIPGGGGSGHAEGGLIRGPGGPKSDSIPARVSPGEYIVKADAVSAFGVANLDALNRGLKVPSFARPSFSAFADGGLVSGAGASAGGGDSNINFGISLEEGLVLKHLSGKSAGRIVLQHLVDNPKAASKALSRSS
jgi:hypothetical protein